MATKKAKKPVNFYVWLRSGLRSLSRKWPAIYEALAAAKVPYKGDNPRRKWSYICNMCKLPYDGKMVSVDHRIPTGQLGCKEDIADFVEKLFCPVGSLQVLCDDCHSCKTYMERYGGTMEEARLAKDVIEICKRPVKEIVAFCSDYGYTAVSLSNSEKRKQAVTEILKSKT